MARDQGVEGEQQRWRAAPMDAGETLAAQETHRAQGRWMVDDSELSTRPSFSQHTGEWD